MGPSFPQLKIVLSLLSNPIEDRAEAFGSALHVLCRRLIPRLRDRVGNLPGVHHGDGNAVERLGASVVEFGQHRRKKLLSLPLIFHKGRDSTVPDKGDIILQALIRHETVAGPSVSPMPGPLLAASLHGTFPAEFNSSFLYGARDKGAAGSHAPFALASSATALGLAVVSGAKPA